MTGEAVRRRDLMKALSAGGAVSVLSTPALAAKGPKVSLLEVGIRFDVHENHDYRLVHLEGVFPFGIDRNGHAVVREQASDEIIRAFESGGAVVSGGEITSPPATATTTKSISLLPMALSMRRRPMYFYSLKSEFTPPSVSVDSDGDYFQLSTADASWTVEPNSERTVELPPETVTIETTRMTEDVVEVPGVREEQWGTREDVESVEVTATPIVEARNLGTLDVLFGQQSIR